jgi:hypothetical protein
MKIFLTRVDRLGVQRKNRTNYINPLKSDIPKIHNSNILKKMHVNFGNYQRQKIRSTDMINMKLLMKIFVKL